MMGDITELIIIRMIGSLKKKAARSPVLFDDCEVCAYVRRMEEQDKQLELEELREVMLRTSGMDDLR